MSRVGDEVAFGLENLGWPLGDLWHRVDTVLADVGFAYPHDRATGALSGGEQQRLALAGALATRPDLLLLDEPTANLDPTATEAVEQIVREIRTDGARIVMTSHNLAQAMRVADDIVFLSAGRVVSTRPRPASSGSHSRRRRGCSSRESCHGGFH